MTIAGLRFDVYDDEKLCIASANRESLHGVSVMDPIDVEKLQDKDFALVMKTGSRTIRKYPIKDADSEKLSSVYFASVKKNLHPSIVKTAESGFSRKNNEIDISKLSSQETGYKYNEYPLHNAEHVKEAMARFSYTTQRMEPREKYAYAQAIVGRAADLSVMVDGPVLGYTNPKINDVSVKLGTLLREKCIPSSMLDDLHIIADNPSPEKFIAFDKIAGLTQYVAEGKIPDGYETCFSFIKSASLKDEQILNIPLTTIEALFDPAFAKEWATDPVAVYNSLPTPTKGMIDKQASFNVNLDKGIPAAMAMLAVAAVAKNKGAASVINKQFESKGWVVGKDCVYQKGEDKIIRKDSGYHWVDADGLCKMKAESLPKLYSMISGDYVKR